MVLWWCWCVECGGVVVVVCRVWWWWCVDCGGVVVVVVLWWCCGGGGVVVVLVCRVWWCIMRGLLLRCNCDVIVI